MIVLTQRPLHERLWRSYKAYRLVMGRCDALFAACYLQWLHGKKRGRR